MDFDDEIPVIVTHVLESNISQNACVVEQNVYSAKCPDRCLDDPLAVLYTVIVGYSLAAAGFNFINNNICSLDERLECALLQVLRKRETALCTFDDRPSPLKEPPRSLTTTFAPLEPKKSAYAFPSLGSGQILFSKAKTSPTLHQRL